MVEVVKDNKGVAVHQHRFGNRYRIAKGPGSLGLKVPDAIVADVADGTPGKVWDALHRNELNVTEIVFQGEQGVSLEVKFVSRLNYLVRVFEKEHRYPKRERVGEF